MTRHSLLAFAAVAAIAACAQKPADAAAAGDEIAATAAKDSASALAAAISGAHRTPEEAARDAFRHPAETLTFFGAEPDQTIVEVWPGGGWYTNIIAPFLKSGGGVYYAAGLDPKANERAAESVRAFAEKYAKHPEIYGEVRLSALADADIAPEGSVDLVVTFRNVHNWLGAPGAAEANFQKFYKALKPGGVLGVVEHRAPDDAAAEFEKTSGYVRVETVKALAAAAGFEFEASSDVNANPNDTKDHPFGVWTLPPVRRSSAVRGVEDPAFDRAKYDAIGESDRMTLKFRKPLAADGALLE